MYVLKLFLLVVLVLSEFLYTRYRVTWFISREFFSVILNASRSY